MLRFAVLALCALHFPLSALGAEPAEGAIRSELLFTLFAPLDAGESIDRSLTISNVRASGGWVKGPKISGRLISPGGDWSRILASGVLRLDVRLTIRTDDGALIYMSYNGVERDAPSTAKKIDRGELLKAQDVKVWLVAPTFETSAPAYDWLNETQAIGRMVEYKEGTDGYVKYDVYSIK